jgi:phosphatidyl-myo-inositol dimannoside synthase
MHTFQSIVSILRGVQSTDSIMYPSSYPSAPSAAPPSQSFPESSEARYLFIFLEIFSREGGIQSYVQDIFQSYLGLTDRTTTSPQPLPRADVFLLRDAEDCTNPFAGANLTFRYFKRSSAAWERIGLAIALLIYLVQHRPQRVFCGHIHLAPLVWLLCKPLGIPYTVLTYGKEVWEPLPVFPRTALQQADCLWTISRYSRDQACQANQLNPDKIQFLPCAVDGDRFLPGSKSPELLEKYGLGGSMVLITVARLWSGDIYKGVDVTIRALPAIAQTIPTVKYLVIGRGDDQPRLAALAAELGVADRVVFAGFVPTDALADYYRLADAYVMPSQEGFGIVYLEAMSCGIPVLAGDADGSADPLQDGQLGWQVPHRNSDAVAQACIEILQNKLALAQGLPHDRRCDGLWLRQQAIDLFGKAAFQQRFALLLDNFSQHH